MGRTRSFDEADVVTRSAAAFVATGYEGTSVDDLVAATGLHRGSLYQAFGSKRGLFLAGLEAARGRPEPTEPDLDLLLVALLDVAPTDVAVRDLCGRLMARLPGDDPARLLGERLVHRAGLAPVQHHRHHPHHRRRALVNTVTIADDRLVVEPRGLDKLWSLTRRLEVPLAHVAGATYDPGAGHEPKGFRNPGLSIPGKTAGSYDRDGERIFYNVSDPSRTLVVELRDEAYARLVLTVEEPRALARAVNDAADRARG